MMWQGKGKERNASVPFPHPIPACSISNMADFKGNFVHPNMMPGGYGYGYLIFGE